MFIMAILLSINLRPCWASLAVSMLLWHCSAEAHYQTTCLQSLQGGRDGEKNHNSDNHDLVWGPTDFARMVRDMTHSRIAIDSSSDGEWARLFEQVSHGQPYVRLSPDQDDDDAASTFCHQTVETIATELLGIEPDLQDHCVDFFQLHHQNGMMVEAAHFQSFLHFVGDQQQRESDDDDNNNLSKQPWTTSAKAIYTEYQANADSMLQNDDKEILDHLCWEIVVEGTLLVKEQMHETITLRDQNSKNNNHVQAQSVPAPAPSLVLPKKSPRMRGSASQTARTLQTDDEFRTCQTQLLISNDIVRDTALWPKEFILFLNRRFNTTYTSDVLLVDIPDPYRQAYGASIPNGADYPVILGVIPGSETDVTRPILWDICQRADAAHAQVMSAPTPVVPTFAPVGTTFAPVPTNLEPDAFFKSLCNVAIQLGQLNEDNLPGLTRQEYVRTLGIALKNDLTIADPFDGLSTCFQNIFFSYGIEPIPLVGTTANPIDEPTLGFCRAIYQTNLLPCVPPTAAPSPSVPTVPTVDIIPTSAPTISDLRFQLCLSQLDASDVSPRNDRISKTEYPAFINKLFFGAVPLVPYDQLTPQFQNVFDSYVSPTGEIIISGAGNIGVASPLQVSFLKGLCRDAYDAPNAPSPTPPPNTAPTAAPIEGEEDVPDCFQGLMNADAGDMNDMLSQAEYVVYLQSLGITADSFNALPYILRDNFAWITDIRGEFNINGATSPAATQEMRELLTLSCERTDEVVESTKNGNDEVLRDDHCFGAFTSADTDVDNRINEAEFVQFVNFFLGIQHSTSFDSLEPDFRRFFNENKDVNTDAIDVTGSKPGDNPTGVRLAVLGFLCEGMETRVADVRSENIVLDQCSRTLEIANTNADNSLSDEEFASFIYILAGLAPTTASFALLSSEAQSFYANFAASLATLDFVAWTNGGQLEELERIALVNNCNQAKSFSDDFTPSFNNVTTIFNSFVIINDSNITASSFNSSASSQLRDLHRAYNAFVYSEVAESVASSSRRLRGRKLLVLGVENFSPDIYQIDDSACPSDRPNSKCQTAYARFELVHVNETDFNELQSRYQNATQRAIADGDLQNALDEVNNSSLIEILRANDQLTPDESSNPGAAPGTRSGGGDDDNESLLFIIVGICGGVGICCCCLAFYMCFRRRSPRSRVPNTGRDDKDTASYPGEMNVDDDDGLGNFQADDAGKDNRLGAFGSSTSDQDTESDEDGEEFGFQDEPNEMPEQSPFGKYDTKTPAFQDEYETEEYGEEEYSEESFEEESVPEESEEESSGEYEDEEPAFGADGQFGSQSPKWQTEEETQDAGSNWGGQSPFASTFVAQDSPTQPEEASYYSAANSKKSAGSKKSASSKKSNQSSKGSSSSKVSEPPENAFEDNFYDNTGQAEMEEVEIDDSDDDSSSYDSEVAGEKLKPPVEAQEEYGYEYDESMVRQTEYSIKHCSSDPSSTIETQSLLVCEQDDDEDVRLVGL